MIRNVRKIRKENFTKFFDGVSIFGQKMAKLGVDCKIRIILLRYRKIPNVSPGLIKVSKHFLVGLYSGGLIFGGAYIRRAFCVSVRVSRP